MAATITRHEVDARNRKVQALVRFLRQNGDGHATPDTLRQLTDEQWTQIAGWAGVHTPSPATREQVISMIAAAGPFPAPVPQPADPFEGL